MIGRVLYHQLGSRDPVWRWSISDPLLAGRPGWGNTHGEMPSRRQAMDRLIERWQELRRIGVAATSSSPSPFTRARSNMLFAGW